MTASIVINVVFALLNVKWSRDSFNEGRDGFGWFFLVCSAWCASSILLEVL